MPATTVLVGLVGAGIQLSRSPAMHRFEGQRLGLEYVYHLFDIDVMTMPKPSLQEIVRAAEICGFAGLNITYPYKQQVIEFLDELSDTAQSVEAVNTVVFRDGKRIGHNTDMWGFSQSYRECITDAPADKVLLIGAGGAGTAVANALAENGVEQLFVFDTEIFAATTLVQRLNKSYCDRMQSKVLESFSSLPLDFNGVVNATPIGMAKYPGSPFPLRLLRRDMWVADIVYFPLQTELLQAAEKIGCRVMPGSGMAVYQAYRAFELFTGLKPDSDNMQTAFESFDRSVDPQRPLRTG